ncbi:MAG: hypothetical protein OER86_13715, partial [Phycisphaerae bacterium]|nr:hypothetical protein [Phycisphaerae bacterium]
GAAVLLGTSRGIGAELLGQAIAAGTVILAIEPLPFALPPLPRTPSGGQGGVALFPWFRLSPAWKSAVEAPKALGQITSVAFSALCPHGQLSLFAQLYGAMDLLLDLLGPADTVDASLTGPLVEAPEDVTALTGDLSAHLRFADRAAATIQLSDRAGQWRRRLVAIGTEGQLTLEDDTYQLLGPSGQILDEVMAGSKPAVEPAALMGYQWQHLVDRLANPDPSDPAQLLASCQATVLSCRTGQLESPRRLMELYGA